MKPFLEVRQSSKSEFATAVEWAKQEGWNPGLDDLDAFFTADPNGFFMGFLDGQPVTSISVVRYCESYGFLGFYIVHPQFRGFGYGIATWQKGMDYLSGRTVGLDGVVDQQENYRRSGFEFAGRNIRYCGRVIHRLKHLPSVTVQPAAPDHAGQLNQMDADVFGVSRTDFLTEWMFCHPNTLRRTLVAMNGQKLLGYGTIRECAEGYKIGPLVADTFDVANTLFDCLCDTCPAGSDVYLDVPQDNEEALTLSRSKGMVPVFETARMYRGDAPSPSLSNVFGITTFELG